MADSKSNDDDDHFFDTSDDFPFFDCPSSPSSSSSSSSFQSTLTFSSPSTLRRRKSASRPDSPAPPPAPAPEDTDNVETVNIDTNNEPQFHLLVFIAEFIIKAIGFQFNLIVNFVTLPFTLFYYTCLVVINPLYIVRVCRDHVVDKLMITWNMVRDWCHPYVFDWVNENQSVLKLTVRYGLGLLWSGYVCVMLVSLLVSSFLFSGMIMRYYVVEQPFELKQGLNFDFTKTRPSALVPISVCNVVDCDEKNEFESFGNGGGDGGVRVIPPYHKLQAIVTLVLPESYYNRNLGIFQIRVDFLSENGKSLSSLSRTSMLEFKSEPIRLLLTFFKVIPLVSGYMSETQTLSLKYRGYNEGVIPTACIKVTIEQRAEFRPGAGIPEIYDAYLHLESELPFLKRCVWHWRRTIFVWLSMVIFVAELLFCMLCCRPLLLPRARTRVNITTSSDPQTTSQVRNQNTS